jgi:hypothetical protein
MTRTTGTRGAALAGPGEAARFSIRCLEPGPGQGIMMEVTGPGINS